MTSASTKSPFWTRLFFSETAGKMSSRLAFRLLSSRLLVWLFSWIFAFKIPSLVSSSTSEARKNSSRKSSCLIVLSVIWYFDDFYSKYRWFYVKVETTWTFTIVGEIFAWWARIFRAGRRKRWAVTQADTGFPGRPKTSFSFPPTFPEANVVGLL